MEFFINCDPPKTTYQSGQQLLRTKQGRWFVGKGAKGRQMANLLRALVLPFRPTTPMDGALKLYIEWRFPWKKTELKRNIALGTIPCITKPDADNIAKGIIDAMDKAGYFVDDSRICDLQIVKLYSNKSGIKVRLDKADVSNYE